MFDEQENAAIAFATQLTNETRVEDPIMQALTSSLSAAQIVELTATVGLANFTNRFNEALGVELP